MKRFEHERFRYGNLRIFEYSSENIRVCRCHVLVKSCWHSRLPRIREVFNRKVLEIILFILLYKEMLCFFFQSGVYSM